MEVVKAYRTELKPTKAQEVLLRKHIGTARFTYNWGLARRIEEYKLTGKSSSAITQHKQLNERMLTYKCEWRGGLVTRAPKSYPSTKRCFVCGAVKQMSLSDRVYRCASCGTECSRDLNSAMNLAQVRSVRPELKPVERTARKAPLGSRKLENQTVVTFGK